MSHAVKLLSQSSFQKKSLQDKVDRKNHACITFVHLAVRESLIIQFYLKVLIILFNSQHTPVLTPYEVKIIVLMHASPAGCFDSLKNQLLLHFYRIKPIHCEFCHKGILKMDKV